MRPVRQPQHDAAVGSSHRGDESVAPPNRYRAGVFGRAAGWPAAGPRRAGCSVSVTVAPAVDGRAFAEIGASIAHGVDQLAP